MNEDIITPKMEDATLTDKADQPPILSEKSAIKTKQKPKINVESVSQFIELAYQKKGKPVPLSKSVANKLGSTPPMSVFERDRLLALARKDLPLAVARIILLATLNLSSTNKLREVLRSFVRDVFLIHPAFAAEKLQAFIRNLPEAIDPARAVELILSAHYPPEEYVEGKKSLNAKDQLKLRDRIISCFAVWLVVTKRMSLDIVLKLLYPTVWKHEAAKVKGEGRRVSQMLDLADLTRVALACSAYEGFLNEQTTRADTAVRNFVIEAQKTQQLSNFLKKAEEQLASQESYIKEMKELIEEERKKAHTEKLHHLDKYEKLRGRILRRLKSETTLLDDGLQALRRDPPKVHVMLDHADRAISALKSEIRNLEPEGER